MRWSDRHPPCTVRRTHKKIKDAPPYTAHPIRSRFVDVWAVTNKERVWIDLQLLACSAEVSSNAWGPATLAGRSTWSYRQLGLQNRVCIPGAGTKPASIIPSCRKEKNARWRRSVRRRGPRVTSWPAQQEAAGPTSFTPPPLRSPPRVPRSRSSTHARRLRTDAAARSGSARTPCDHVISLAHPPIPLLHMLWARDRPGPNKPYCLCSCAKP